MANYTINRSGGTRFPLLHGILFLFFCMTGHQALGPLLAGSAITAFTDISAIEFTTTLQNITDFPDLKWMLIVLQGSATLMGYIIFPLLVMRFVDLKPLGIFFKGKGDFLKLALLSVGTIIFFSGINSVINEWNNGIELPEFMSNAEVWMHQLEDRSREMTEYLTFFDTPGHFIAVFIIMGILPAIGEELAFRGYLQGELYAATGNIHTAIWTSAILFSAIHLQFLGFFPRMLLGAIFGYLYVWSGNLWYPIIGHFIQNGLQVILIYLAQLHIIDVNFYSVESVPVPYALVSGGIFVVLILVFKRVADNNRTLQKGFNES